MGEHHLDTVGVVGSIPIAPTIGIEANGPACNSMLSERDAKERPVRRGCARSGTSHDCSSQSLSRLPFSSDSLACLEQWLQSLLTKRFRCFIQIDCLLGIKPELR